MKDRQYFIDKLVELTKEAEAADQFPVASMISLIAGMLTINKEQAFYDVVEPFVIEQLQKLKDHIAKQN